MASGAWGRAAQAAASTGAASAAGAAVSGAGARSRGWLPAPLVCNDACVHCSNPNYFFQQLLTKPYWNKVGGRAGACLCV